MKASFEVLRDRLSMYFGANTAHTALKTFCHKSMDLTAQRRILAHEEERA